MRSGILAPVLATVLLMIGCGAEGEAESDRDGDGIVLYRQGRRVRLEGPRAAELGDQARNFFARCHTARAVSGTQPSQDELRQLWRGQERGTWALMEERTRSDPPFDHLKERSYALLLGVDSASGVTVVLTEHDGLLTPYIKCPGLESMDLGCELARQVPGALAWPVCGEVERVRRELEGRGRASKGGESGGAHGEPRRERVRPPDAETSVRRYGPLAGCAPTGRRVVMTGRHIEWVVDGRVVERWGESDHASLVRQSSRA